MEKRKSNPEKIKRVLFLSADDFKQKSIQVIRKTPEAYVNAGWDVTYVVLRDSSLKGNYYYEVPIELIGVRIIRKEVPGTKMLNAVNNKLLIAILVRVRRYLAIIYLIFYGIKYLKKEHFDVLYGYEQPGSVAAKFIKQFFGFKKTRFVTRFQGVVFVKEWLRNNLWYRKITNFDTFYALKGPSDLCIMTNDGSCGDWVLEKVKANHKKVAFWSNGVDKFNIDTNRENELKNQYKGNNEFLFVSVSRIDDHKRVDRCIKFFNTLLSMSSDFNFHYLIVGEGAKIKECEILVETLNLKDRVTFAGAVNQSEVPLYLSVADAFISMYESSNVGNPLLEAIRLNKLILTLNNGGTSEWINHKNTGLIYPVDDNLDLSQVDYDLMAQEFLDLIVNQEEIVSIKEKLSIVCNNKLWTWEERFSAELNEVGNLIC
ncbi:glycosyltransferase family 4 protein [Flavobacterium sp.]|uniref:glycosyltransferase family 4 protein n=1 Tax=Flavobacterium sp. TaxID=239 RepID=UPI0025B94111|nr:glycosyltransferase family 4 protein [Flavobacterium sp.]